LLIFSMNRNAEAFLWIFANEEVVKTITQEKRLL